MKLLFAFLVSSLVVLAGCSSKSVTPDTEELTVKRTAPPERCKSMGPVTGSTMTAKGNAEEALEDMKKSAASKGADYLWVKQYSDNGTGVTGEAYECR